MGGAQDARSEGVKFSYTAETTCAVYLDCMATAGGGSSRLKWITDLEKTVLLSNFEKRGWVRGSSEGMVFCELL